jgi:glyoxylase-like metal-dependent hydrolase (beta-lactamase superfamily II)
VIWAGEADWRHFVTGPGEMLPHIRAGWRAAADAARFRPLDRDTAIAPGITAVLAPGRTPGHLCVVLSSGAQRALLLGFLRVLTSAVGWPRLRLARSVRGDYHSGRP